MRAFNTIMQGMMGSMPKNKRRSRYLFANQLSNQWMALILWIVNPFFVLSAEEVNNAILNIVAIAFILDIDDVILPIVPSGRESVAKLDWNKESPPEELVKFAMTYVTCGPEKGSGVRVKKTPSNFVASNTDTCFIVVKTGIPHVIQVFCSRESRGTQP